MEGTSAGALTAAALLMRCVLAFAVNLFMRVTHVRHEYWLTIPQFRGPRVLRFAIVALLLASRILV